MSESKKIPNLPVSRGYGWITSVDKPIRWVVKIDMGENERYQIELDEEYRCFYNGSWTPNTPEQAIIAAIDRIVENERSRLKLEATNLSVERLG